MQQRRKIVVLTQWEECWNHHGVYSGKDSEGTWELLANSWRSGHGEAGSGLFHEASSGRTRRLEGRLWESQFCGCKFPHVFVQPRDTTVVEGFSMTTSSALIWTPTFLTSFPWLKPCRAPGRQCLVFAAPWWSRTKTSQTLGSRLALSRLRENSNPFIQYPTTLSFLIKLISKMF